MKVTVIGSGYVGLVTGACLAELGNQVCCFDVNQDKVGLLNNGEIPIYEPGLKELIASGRENNRLISPPIQKMLLFLATSYSLQ